MVLKSKSALCHYLGIDTPDQDIIKANFLLTHKMISSNQPKQILDQINIPRRSCGKLYFKGKFQSERAKRSPIVAGISLYNALPQSIKILPHKKLKLKLKKLEIKYSMYK